MDLHSFNLYLHQLLEKTNRANENAEHSLKKTGSTLFGQSLQIANLKLKPRLRFGSGRNTPMETGL